ncbi:hypothetical protein COU79_04400 [Candidatus Peregrinibacteria bacterium CG10_big_fil_rev_8_21_14_0_10_54_7]|nr:MAG: hypothetical protein COU79_04400 [Candidatus Peregrinibacteria bacterium CG10_big_fil_rev_8_21_14_0_10_54_7]
MAPEGDPAARYRELAGALAILKCRYAFNADPKEESTIESGLTELRDALVALLDSPENVQQIAAAVGKPAEAFEKARDAIRNKDVKEWKQMS